MISVGICLLVMAVLQLSTPYWWWVMVVPFAYALLFSKSGWKAFGTGLLSAGLLWLGAGVYALTTSSDIIAGRVAAMLGLPATWVVLALTALLAGLAGGFGGSTGYLLRAAVRPVKSRG